MHFSIFENHFVLLNFFFFSHIIINTFIFAIFTSSDPDILCMKIKKIFLAEANLAHILGGIRVMKT